MGKCTQEEMKSVDRALMISLGIVEGTQSTAEDEERIEDQVKALNLELFHKGKRVETLDGECRKLKEENDFLKGQIEAYQYALNCKR